MSISKINPFKGVGQAVKDVATGAINRTLQRLTGAGLGGNSRLSTRNARWNTDGTDWRVKLTLPPNATQLRKEIFNDGNNSLLSPLQPFDGMFWPLTPSMVIQHSANYNALAQTHSNYPFQAYQNSQVDQMNIIGEFPVQNSEDAKHWIATVQFLRGITKMFFGGDNANPLKGNPPPILFLNGYGQHMFSNVPVVVNSFNVELRSGIDYISTKGKAYVPPAGPAIDPTGMLPQVRNDETTTYAPTLSNISVLITPIYSRESIGKNFNLRDFFAGKLSGREDGIGFI